MVMIENYVYDKKRIIDAAVKYAQNGIAVVPILGRAPLYGENTLFSSKDPAEVERIYTEDTRNLNIGIALGSPSGVVAITTEHELPGRKGYDAYIKLYGPLPKTATILNPQFPRHHFYHADPKYTVKGNVRICENMFMRGDGEYMILPPSAFPLLIGEYHFEEGTELFPDELPECPEVAIRLVKKRQAYLRSKPIVPGQQKQYQFL